MKYFFILLMFVVTILGLCSCANSFPKSENTMLLEAALDAYMDMSADYDGSSFPAKFTQEEINACMKNKTYKGYIEQIQEKFVSQFIEEAHRPIIDILNNILTLDYVFRPAHKNNADAFTQRLQILIDADCVYNQEFMEVWVRGYVRYMGDERITKEVVDFAVPIIDKYSPIEPELKRENVKQAEQWITYDMFAVEMIYKFDKAAALRRGQESSEWFRRLAKKEESLGKQ